MDKVRGKLSEWTWVLPKLSYGGRVLIANNLIATMLWHKFIVIDPPTSLVGEVQWKLVDFFWTGEHWTNVLVLYLFSQGLGSRIKVF